LALKEDPVGGDNPSFLGRNKPTKIYERASMGAPLYKLRGPRSPYKAGRYLEVLYSNPYDR